MTDESNLTEGEQAITETPVVSGEDQPPAPTDDNPTPPVDDSQQPPASDDGEEAPQGAPEKYEWSLGEGVAVDEQLAGEFEPIARELNLSNDQANKLASEMLPKVQQRMSDNWQKQVDEWKQAAESDKEFGGAKFEQTMTDARKALESYGSPELTEVLDQTGLGNHPALIRVFAQMGASMKEDRTVKPEGAPAGKLDLTSAFYPNAKK
ncbi:hypothetical protein [Alcanivorax jadensis]|uniref:hypothetical protein n=1 Tax=Alcanivorax jadensis TaxID=64988 RepID=UPI002356C0BB|nr:hypothetical protein [Alcanivorax jadensis]|tara:strand:- start:1108 stop:1731 length:624 start_codon:yes stop_codon:yes gene_type:complete